MGATGSSTPFPLSQSHQHLRSRSLCRWNGRKFQSAQHSLKKHSLACASACLALQQRVYIASDRSFAINRSCILFLLCSLIKSNMKWPIKTPKPVKQRMQPVTAVPRREWEELKIQGTDVQGAGGHVFLLPPVLFKLSLRSKKYLGGFCCVLVFLFAIGW